MSEEAQAIGTPAFDPAGYLSLMVEHGWTARLTFGLEAGRADAGDHKAFLYVARSVGPADATHRFAVRAGLGRIRAGGVDEAAALAGLSWGRGFTTGLGDGWAAVDSTLHYRFGTGDIVAKTDATLGLKPRDGLQVFVQFQAGRYPGNAPYLRAVPSLAWEFSPGRHVEVGVPVGLVGDNAVGLKIGAWLEF
ncbi:hypothetical protein P1J78_24255 [Psychromarinibacter sp. C21-152]|uniref:Uncharacterized protein n=1 Tax=Psychromarinibacter sediminicola TaxID=3033385 RepID=A0AAE3TAK4_9RHOB|nr:hypothetical protein [Psychromarinibacter sediminicola]MDF0603830.1 hypothetical protein [Psychromarinibacter sediminicola]